MVQIQDFDTEVMEMGIIKKTEKMKEKFRLYCQWNPALFQSKLPSQAGWEQEPATSSPLNPTPELRKGKEKAAHVAKTKH